MIEKITLILNKKILSTSDENLSYSLLESNETQLRWVHPPEARLGVCHSK